MNDLKAAADNTCTAKALFDLLGRGVGGDIKSFGFLPSKGREQRRPRRKPRSLDPAVARRRELPDEKSLDSNTAARCSVIMEPTRWTGQQR